MNRTSPAVDRTGLAGRRPIPASHPLQNDLLAALPAEDFERIAPHLEQAQMEPGHSIYEAGARQPHAYFPVGGIVSLLYATTAGASAELAVIGSEGIVGIALFMGSESTPNRAVVQSACHAYRLDAARLKEEFARLGPVHLQLLKYTQALLTQISQTAVCNRHHSVEQQLCRWLLLSLDRLAGDELKMTQELIGNMLAVRGRVSDSTGALERSGLIRYRRGTIVVLDRAGVEARACECYGVVRREYDRLRPSVTRAPRGASCGRSPSRRPH